MTIGRPPRRFGFASVLSLLLLCLILFSSCTANGDPLDGLEPLSPQSPSDPISGAGAYRILTSAICDRELSQAANALAEAITQQTGVLAYVLNDDEDDWNEEENVCVILLGRTNHPLSHFYFSERNRDDYICRIVDGTLLLGGPSDSATVKAIERFIDECLPLASAEVLMTRASEFEYTAAYTWEDATLNSFSIQSYTLVYDRKNDLREASVAELLREKIADRCGAYPEIQSEESFDGSGNAIVIGTCFGYDPDMVEGTAYLVENGRQICLYALDSYGLSKAAELLVERLFASGEEGIASLSLKGTTELFYERPMLSMLNMTSEWSDPCLPTDFADLANRIESAEVNFITLGQMTAEVWGLLAEDLSSAWTCFCAQRPDGTVIPILYRADVFSLIDPPKLHELNGSVLVELTLFSKVDQREMPVFYLLEEKIAESGLMDSVETLCGGRSDAVVILDLCGESPSVPELLEDEDVILRFCSLKSQERVLAVLSRPASFDLEARQNGEKITAGVFAFYQVLTLGCSLIP